MRLVDPEPAAAPGRDAVATVEASLAQARAREASGLHLDPDAAGAGRGAMSRRCAERGLSLLECLVALAILSIILLMSFTVLDRYKIYLRRVDERLLATRAAEGELELLLARGAGALRPWARSEGESRPPELARLAGARLTSEVFSTRVPELLRVRVELAWNRDEGRAVVAEALRFTGARPRRRGEAEE